MEHAELRLQGKILANMAAFKEHASFGFWRGAEVMDGPGRRDAMGDFGRIASVEDLPPREEIDAGIARAMALIDAGPALRKLKAAPKQAAEMPDDLTAALADNPAARITFDSFPPSARREYIDWVVEAKRPETRTKRLAQAVDWLAEGKRRNWKYENC